jgi:hypothetical protein
MSILNGRGAVTHTSWTDHEIVAPTLLNGKDGAPPTRGERKTTTQAHQGDKP